METIDYVINTLETLVNIPSPSGYTKRAIEFVASEAEKWGFSSNLTNKGGLTILVPGESKEITGLSAHVDTLGAMVRSITPNGYLNIVPIGGYLMESIEASYCKIHCRDGKTYDGTILTKSPSIHTFDDAKAISRMERNMEVRIDEIVNSPEDVRNLGLDTGAFISFNPEFCYTESGYIKSRHLDDKASVAVLLGLLYDIHKSGKSPKKSIIMVISNYEEIGHGASYLPEGITELLAIDMGALGDDLTGDETKVSICAKDSTGPYDFDMTNELITIAKDKNLDFAVDIFPHYGSDVSAAYRAGCNIRGALIGPGVHASHSMERTHKKGLENTLALIKDYVL